MYLRVILVETSGQTVRSIQKQDSDSQECCYGLLSLKLLQGVRANREENQDHTLMSDSEKTIQGRRLGVVSQKGQG